MNQRLLNRRRQARAIRAAVADGHLNTAAIFTIGDLGTQPTKSALELIAKFLAT